MPLVRPCLTTLAGNEPSELGQQGSRKRGGPLQQWVVWKSGPQTSKTWVSDLWRLKNLL